MTTILNYIKEKLINKNIYKSRKIMIKLLESRGYEEDEWNDFRKRRRR